MPIYAYRCATCGHAKDVLQKISDPLLTVCPACGAETFTKQVTAAGFQLKGSGWYVTDFRDKPAPAPAAGAAKPGEAGATSGDASKSSGSDAPSAPSAAPASAAPAPAPSGDAKKTPAGSPPSAA